VSATTNLNSRPVCSARAFCPRKFAITENYIQLQKYKNHCEPNRSETVFPVATSYPVTEKSNVPVLVPIRANLECAATRIDEIEKAHFLLADLTYARPSVYFEAGYGQRSVSVIYTARVDHFRARDGDPSGNLRVHFDLQMKNIITWTEPLSKKFQKRLQSRITKVLLPIARRVPSRKEMPR
jgi:hypothetical protein